MQLNLKRVRPMAQQISTEAFCVASSGMHTKSNKEGMLLFNPSARNKVDRERKEAWIALHELWVCGARAYTPIVTPAGELYWMDCITGSLFRNDGRCLSSLTMTMDVSKLRDDPVDAAAILRNASTAEMAA